MFRTYRRIREDLYVDFQAFYYAGRAVLDGTDIYRSGEGYYIYPPLLATAFSPLARLPIADAARLWCWLAAAGTALSLWLVQREFVRRWQVPNAAAVAPAALGISLFLWIEQLRWEFEQGQSDWLLLLGLAGAFAWMDRRPWLAGLMLGLAINVKYLPLALLAYFAVRQRWRSAAWTIAGTAFWALAPAAILGWERNLDSLKVAFAGVAKLFGVAAARQPLMVFPLDYEYSLSIPSGVARLCAKAGLGPAWLAGIVAGILALTVGAAAAIYRGRGVPLFVGRGGTREADPARAGVVAWEWLGVLTLMLVFSPQMHNRHLYILLPLPLAAALLAVRTAPARWHWPTLTAGWFAALAMAVPFGTHEARPDLAFGWWQAYGGGACGVVAVYLFLLSYGLRGQRFAAR